MLKLEDIEKIYKNTDDNLKGYYIKFNDGRKIHLSKKRTIIALLVLIKNGTGTGADIGQGNTSIHEIKKILGNKLEKGIINDYYRDANKPYSELWNEEGFSFIDNLKGGRTGKSQTYTLKTGDHNKLFGVLKKAYRKAPTAKEQDEIRKKQKGKCNFCGSNIFKKSQLKKDSFAKDRRKEAFDHRHPVERGGDSGIDNFQNLCFYCNKCKWQICNICTIKNCDTTCALRNPETSNIIAPTKEDISDLLADRNLFE